VILVNGNVGQIGVRLLLRWYQAASRCRSYAAGRQVAGLGSSVGSPVCEVMAVVCVGRLGHVVLADGPGCGWVLGHARVPRFRILWVVRVLRQRGVWALVCFLGRRYRPGLLLPAGVSELCHVNALCSEMVSRSGLWAVSDWMWFMGVAPVWLFC